MSKENKTYLHRLGEDPDLTLEYGVPLGGVSYELHQSIEDPLDDFELEEEIDRRAAQVVEEFKNQGRPGAFVVRRSNYKKKGEDVVDIWVPQL